MELKRILITGGAGFAGSNLAIRFRTHFPNAHVIAFDNLKRRGSELSIKRLRSNGVEFVHGDVRMRSDFLDIEPCDLIIDCAAEPSVLAGSTGSPDYVIDTNLVGTINCLEFARRNSAAVIFLSTSRVYPVAKINSLNFSEKPNRFELSELQNIKGASQYGIAEDFPLEGSRSLYGASKLCSELLLQEYLEFGVRAVINRCGVLTGPWQMGKVDQGVVVLWVAKHIFGGALSYIGYGGTGKQVRDILHIDDLWDLLQLQLASFDRLSGHTFNVGGGSAVSVSLAELTELCRDVTGRSVEIASVVQNRPNDLLLYITDNRKVSRELGWAPKRSPDSIIKEISDWILENQTELRPILS